MVAAVVGSSPSLTARREVVVSVMPNLRKESAIYDGDEKECFRLLIFFRLHLLFRGDKIEGVRFTENERDEDRRKV